MSTNNEDKLILGGHEFTSRFILGSGKFSLDLVKACIEKADAQIITLALRRANEGGLANILDYIPKNVTLLPNTSGARNAEEAVRIARLSREIGCGDFVKIEVIHDSKYLLPDNYETVKATEILAKEGFVVMPYMYPDLNAARDLVNAGAACIMPLGSPIGSNKGLCTKEFIQILIDEIELPIIVDAGIGRPSQACEAMEMGASAVMANTAIATAATSTATTTTTTASGVAIQYVGNKSLFKDHLYNSALTFTTGQVRHVNSDLATKLLKHPEFQLYVAESHDFTESEQTVDDTAAVLANAQIEQEKKDQEQTAVLDEIDVVNQMTKDALIEYAQNKYQQKLNKQNSVATLRTQVAEFIHQFGVV